MKLSAITLDQLQVFLSVVETGSFSAAARDLGRAQSAVSYAIANLERLLEVQLFDRSGRLPVLTREGATLLADARSVHQRMEMLEAHARSMREGAESQVSLAVDMLYPTDSLREVLADFRQTYPHVGLLLRTEALGAVVELVLSGVCRVGVSNSHLAAFPESLVSQSLGTVALFPVAAPDHPLAKMQGPVPRSVVDDFIQLVITDRSQRTAGVDAGVLGSRTWRLAELATKHAMLLGGFGWGNMPSHSVSEDLAEGRLVRLNLEGWDVDIVPLFSIHRRDTPPGPATRWLVERLRQAF